MEKSREAFRTISEVAEWLETPAHVLRFWESKFTQVKPLKRAGGRRYYRPADMLLLGGIKRLLHEDGLTIKGVQKILREQGVRHVAALSQHTLTEAEASELVEPEGDGPAADTTPDGAVPGDQTPDTAIAAPGAEAEATPEPAEAQPLPDAAEPAAQDTEQAPGDIPADAQDAAMDAEDAHQQVQSDDALEPDPAPPTGVDDREPGLFDTLDAPATANPDAAPDDTPEEAPTRAVPPPATTRPQPDPQAVDPAQAAPTAPQQPDAMPAELDAPRILTRTAHATDIDTAALAAALPRLRALVDRLRAQPGGE